MSIKFLAYAFDARVNNPLRKLVLLKLCDNANDDGECWPSFQHIADQCEISRSSAIRHIHSLIEDGYLSSEARFKNGDQTSNMYLISKSKLLSSIAGTGVTVTPPLVSECTPPSVTVTPRTVIETSIVISNVTPIKKSSKKSDMTFSEWAESLRCRGESLIPSDSSIFDYTERMGIPEDFLSLAWNVFTEYYTTDNLKKYSDWRKVFGNAVKGDWLKLWAFNQSGVCYLTTKGKQHQNLMSARV